jgi:hypothetical protein
VVPCPALFEHLLTIRESFPVLTCSPFVIEDVLSVHLDGSDNANNLNRLQLVFSGNQLTSDKEWHVKSLDRKSSKWMNKAAEIVWNSTHGIISETTMDTVRDTN